MGLTTMMSDDVHDVRPLASPSLNHPLNLTLIRMIAGALDNSIAIIWGRRLLNPGPWARASKPWTLVSNP